MIFRFSAFPALATALALMLAGAPASAESGRDGAARTVQQPSAPPAAEPAQPAALPRSPMPVQALDLGARGRIEAPPLLGQCAIIDQGIIARTLIDSMRASLGPDGIPIGFSTDCAWLERVARNPLAVSPFPTLYIAIVFVDEDGGPPSIDVDRATYVSALGAMLDGDEGKRIFDESAAESEAMAVRILESLVPQFESTFDPDYQIRPLSEDDIAVYISQLMHYESSGRDRTLASVAALTLIGQWPVAVMAWSYVDSPDDAARMFEQSRRYARHLIAVNEGGI